MDSPILQCKGKYINMWWESITPTAAANTTAATTVTGQRLGS
jgi:hypothetical protein